MSTWRAGAGKRGVPAMMKLLDGTRIERPPFAPPFLKAGKLVIAQTANILLYLGERLGLAPRDEAGQLWAHQLQLTITDLVVLIHDTHHPIPAISITSSSARPPSCAPNISGATARRSSCAISSACWPRAAALICSAAGSATWTCQPVPDRRGPALRLSQAHEADGEEIPRVMALHDRVAKRPRIAAYLASQRRIAFSQWGIYRYFKELDV